ncbi:MAG: Zn-dependent exopeptidase M28 [Bacteroidia bacterium]|nr:Zn-dependent exopeptidase M28 [Bacteroidia bacterium]
MLPAVISAQDTVYARKVIRFLTSESCFGRGYLNKGLLTAENYIVRELKNQNLIPLFNGSYTQTFVHNVNTFPKKCEVSINGKKLISGVDFIPNAGSCSAKGKFNLIKADSLSYFSFDGKAKVTVQFKNKLTFSVDNEQSGFCGIELDRKKFSEEPQQIELNIKNKLITGFKSSNIGCYINGSSASDSMVVFSAHYDHLGGLGKHTFFPGANDNASGTSVVLNLIRYYKTHPPKYKTVFLFFAGEEAGLLGSKYFTQSNTLDLKKIKFLINLDLLGTGDDGIMVVNGAVHEKEFALLTKINNENNLVKQVKKRGKAANSDHYWFSEAGVPCFFIYTMGGVTAYHDVFDVEKTLPLTDYVDVFKLITGFVSQL